MIALVGAPIGVLANMGMLELRACAPQLGAITGHVAVLRPDPSCTSGFSFEPVPLVVVGTLAVATLAMWAAGFAVAGGVGFALKRVLRSLFHLVARLLRPVVSLLRSTVAAADTEPHRRVEAPRGAVTSWRGWASVGLRAPPVLG